jgi:glycosyltransferase involved in cell wall biosynthesis
VKIAVIGPASKKYYHYLGLKAQQKKIAENIDFLGPKNNIDEVHAIVAKSKICVLPTHADTIPGTILESMMIGVPCVSYAVGGIPTLNNYGEIIKLVDKGDIQSLANEIIHLLEDHKMRNMLSKKAYVHIMKRWNEDAIYRDVSKAYQSIISL